MLVYAVYATCNVNELELSKIPSENGLTFVTFVTWHILSWCQAGRDKQFKDLESLFFLKVLRQTQREVLSLWKCKKEK